MTINSSNFDDTRRGNHWIGTSASQYSRYKSPNLSSRYQDGQRFRSEINSSSNTYDINRPNSDDKFSTNKNSSINMNISNAMKNKNSSDDHNIGVIKPLISTEVIDIFKQRSLALIIFLLIQLYKLYDLVLLKSNISISGVLAFNSKFSFIVKYLIIDSCYLYFLPSFKIPTLTFKNWTILLQISFMLLLSILITSEREWVFITSIVATWKKYNTRELSVTGNSVNQRRLYDSASHFKGALTIKILPENTAMLNPLQNSYCLPYDDTLFPISTANVPIRINSTADIKFIQLEHRDILTNEVELKNLTKKDWKVVNNLGDLSIGKGLMSQEKFKQETDNSIKYLNLPLREFGFYQIKKIVDSNNFHLKVYNSHLVVAQCPTARIAGLGSKDRCIGDNDKVSIEVEAVAPLQLAYSKIVDGVEQTFFDKNLQPEAFKSPLQKNKRSVFDQQDISDLYWARSQEVVIDLDTTITKSGKHLYKISKIIDGLGNVMNFDQFSSEVLREFEYNYNFNVHSIPRAILEEKADSRSPTKRVIIINFESDELKSDNKISSMPYTAGFQVISPEGKEWKFNITSNNARHEFQAKVPGTYKLQSISSNFCPGVIAGKSSVVISQPIAPQLKVNSNSILDKCLGQIGLDFDLTFTGVPPFNFNAKIYKLEGSNKKLVETKRYSSPSTRFQLSYNPKREGDYEIVFADLSNELFTDAISLSPKKNFTFRTSMRVKPGALFKNRAQKELCLNDNIEVPVVLKGEAPFTLNYDLIEIFSNNRKSFSIDNIELSEYKIVTPKFSVGGEFILSLISVSDSSGCTVPLTEPDTRLRVRRDVPTVSMNFLDKIKTLNINQGSTAEIPIKLSGEAPFVVKFARVDKSGAILEPFESTFNSNYNSVIRASKEGLYKLIDVRDVSCKGQVIDSEKLLKVNYLQRPYFEVLEKSTIKKMAENSFVNSPVCEGNLGSVDLLLSGSAPFTLKYEIISPSGISSVKHMQVATKYASIKVPNSENGEYIIKIINVFDSNYSETNSKGYSKMNETIIKQFVNAMPKVEFAKASKTFRTCITNIEQKELVDPIKLKILEGTGPFSITFNVYHESTGRTEKILLEKVTADSFEYQRLYKGLGLGSHDITIERVDDSNGCSTVVPETDASHVIISITDAPRIQLLDPSAVYCVGDYVSYQLSGSSPFTIRYDFNGIQLKTKEKSTQFVRLASEAGSISINSISDSTSQCLVDFMLPNKKKEADQLSLVIHPLPSVTVSQGEYLIEDIHEGDQAEVIFSFEGTPPFSLTYVRTEDNLNKNIRGKPQIVETHKVTDIYSHEYRVKTSLQGTYEAIEVSDAYCMAKNDAFYIK